jgi:cellulose synthase/poly-beta-1,6-N-acetylglucosamine synthase-like glycosyltransferase
MALLPHFNQTTIDVSDAWTERLAFAVSLVWIVFLPMLVKLAVQITMAVLSILLKGFHKICQQDLFSKTTNQTDQEKSCPPRVSVIIPAYNEEVGILKTIKSVINTNYENLQIIVVNDGSTDATDQIVRRFLKTYDDEDLEEGLLTAAVVDDSHDDHDTASESSESGSTIECSLSEEAEVKREFNKPTIKYLQLENGGKGKAMNTAITHVDGTFVVTLDADSVMDKRAIKKIVKCFGDDSQVGAVAGNVVLANRSKPIGMVQQLEYLSGFFFKRADSMFNAVYIIGGAAASYRKEVLDKVGSFDPLIITEDIELSTRILAMGYKTRYEPDAVVYTEGPSEWTCLCNQRLRWKYGRLETFWRHRDLFFRVRTDEGVRNNWYLTWFLLPIAVYAELLLFLDWIVLPFCLFYIFAVESGPFLAILIILASLTLFQVLVDCKRKFHSNLILIAPMTWLTALAVEMVEFQALLRSLYRFAGGHGLKWQKWKRVGIAEQELDMDE